MQNLSNSTHTSTSNSDKMDMPHTAYRVWQQCKHLGIDKREEA